MKDPIPFIDLQAQRLRLGSRIDEAISRVMAHGKFILGPEVSELEERLAAYTGVRHCVTCANGTDALVLLLMAEEISQGDAVFVPAFTFAATAEAVKLVGATPVFCDVHPDTFNLDAESLSSAIRRAEMLNLNPRAVIPVDLFGQAADYQAIESVADEHDLTVICDAAQAFGASLNKRKVGTFGKATSLSFFPAKPLGCYGDGGAILTADDDIADRLRSLRVHGQGTHKYDNIRVGQNSRLDTIQAAILLQKLAIFDEELQARQDVAERYDELLTGVTTPVLIDGAASAWAQYTIQHEDRTKLAQELSNQGVPTAVYYPKPLNTQKPYKDCPLPEEGVGTSESLAKRVISLPMHPYLDPDIQMRIVEAVRHSVPDIAIACTQ